MAKFDMEDLLDAVEEVMRTKLNARIAAIEVEKVAKGKGLSPALEGIDTDSYYRQSWSEGILNVTPAIFYGTEEITTIDGGGGSAQTYRIFCEVIYCDDGMQNDTHRRIARYARALKEIFEEAFDKVPESSKIKIETVSPISYRLSLDSSEEMKAGGVSLTVTLY